MLEFKTIEEFKPNPKIIELIKNYTCKTKKEKLKFFYILIYRL
ncbi:hypothetical protein SD457_05645 [Coprobacillaceae bacterium CR2/5/TPMF4]|nr:hypothetical protein SD457_05645 [Coprobacillaceae bacterium CR2/5/TPMF4]